MIVQVRFMQHMIPAFVNTELAEGAGILKFNEKFTALFARIP